MAVARVTAALQRDSDPALVKYAFGSSSSRSSCLSLVRLSSENRAKKSMPSGRVCEKYRGYLIGKLAAGISQLLSDSRWAAPEVCGRVLRTAKRRPTPACKADPGTVISRRPLSARTGQVFNLTGIAAAKGAFHAAITSRAILEASGSPPKKTRLRLRPRSGAPATSIGTSSEGTNWALSREPIRPMVRPESSIAVNWSVQEDGGARAARPPP